MFVTLCTVSRCMSPQVKKVPGIPLEFHEFRSLWNSRWCSARSGVPESCGIPGGGTRNFEIHCNARSRVPVPPVEFLSPVECQIRSSGVQWKSRWMKPGIPKSSEIWSPVQFLCGACMDNSSCIPESQRGS